jgi:hypothetical protein
MIRAIRRRHLQDKARKINALLDEGATTSGERLAAQLLGGRHVGR